MFNHNYSSSQKIPETSENAYQGLCSRLGMTTEEECQQMVELCSHIGADTPGQCELLIDNAVKTK